jgi:1-acyl-sn-glycerol-3-phosphate acyltransferase
MIRSALVLLFTAGAVFLVLPWFILWTAITGDAGPMYGVSMKACRVVCRIAGMRLRVEGLENIPSGACIFTANHASNLDPLALMPWIPRRVSVLLKQEVLNIPVLSFGMRQAKFVPIRREYRESTTASLEACREVLRQGLPLVIFPEGTRSRDGRLRRFKKGAFVLGIEAGVPIVPVSISGTRNLLPPGTSSLRPGEVTTRIGPAVDAAQFTFDRRSELTAQVEALVAAGLPPEQRPLAKPPVTQKDSGE